MRERRPLSRRAKILILLLTPIVVFGLLEIGLRIGGYRYEPWREHLEGRSYSELREFTIYAPDPDLIWTLRPSTVLDLEPAGFPQVRTNADGFRGEELPGPKAAGELRVLCLGDSITFGLGLRAGETWPDRMAEALRAAPGMEGRTVTVINMGIPGWSAVQGMRLLDRLGHLDADAIVFWFGLPDAHRMRVLPDSAQSLPVEGLPHVLAVLWKLRVFQLVQSAVTRLRQSAADGTRVSPAEFREAVDRMLELERKGGPRVLFVRGPLRLAQVISELERVVARAEEVRAKVVIGPEALLSWVTPAREGVDLTGRRIQHARGPAILFQPDRADMVRMLDDLRSDLEMVRDLKRAFETHMDELPEKSLGRRDLYGDAPLEEVLVDHCHLTSLGARLVGENLARAVLESLGEKAR